jgi:hypothetical protein
LTVSEEACEFMWCFSADIETLDLVESHVERIEDALRGNLATYVR